VVEKDKIAAIVSKISISNSRITKIKIMEVEG